MMSEHSGFRGVDPLIRGGGAALHCNDIGCSLFSRGCVFHECYSSHTCAKGLFA